MVLHLRGAHDTDGDGVMDLDGSSASAGQRVGIYTEAGQAAVALGQLHHHDGRGEGGRHGRCGGGGGIHDVVAAATTTASRHAVVQRVAPTPSTALAHPKPTPSQRRQHTLERHPQLSQINLKHNDIISRTLDPMLQKYPPRRLELGEARYPLCAASTATVIVGGGFVGRTAAGGNADVVGVEVDDRPAPAEEEGTGAVNVGISSADGGWGGGGRCRGRRRGQFGDGTDEVGQELDVLRGELGLEPHSFIRLVDNNRRPVASKQVWLLPAKNEQNPQNLQ